MWLALPVNGDFSVTLALARHLLNITSGQCQWNSKAGGKQKNEFLLRFSFLLFSYTTLSCTQKIKYIWSATPRSSCRSHLSGTCNLVFVTCFWAQCLATAPYHFNLLFRIFRVPACVWKWSTFSTKNITGINCKT